MDIEALYQKKLMSPEQACLQLDDKQNLILGMGVAMPPMLISTLAKAVQSDHFSALNLYYMHGSQVLSESLLVPELAEKVCPRPLFMSSYDRAALKRLPNRALMEFVPATFHQVGRLLTEQIEPHFVIFKIS